ncbi:MAG: hypothetical protein ACRD3P_19810 [Terriglobales bacterium]
MDRSLGRELIATALREANVSVKVHDDQFAPNARDEEWLAEVGKRGWIVLTKDRRFHTRVLEITAIARAKAKVFKLTAANIQGVDMATIFLKSIRKISRVAIGNPGPFIATVSKSGRVMVVLSSSKLTKYLS